MAMRPRGQAHNGEIALAANVSNVAAPGGLGIGADGSAHPTSRWKRHRKHQPQGCPFYQRLIQNGTPESGLWW